MVRVIRLILVRLLERLRMRYRVLFVRETRVALPGMRVTVRPRGRLISCRDGLRLLLIPSLFMMRILIRLVV